MAANGLKRQSEIEELVAWMDGELPPDQAARVAGLVRQDPPWQATYREFLAVDAALDRLEVPPPSAHLTDRIVRAARRRQMAGRVFRALAPLAAAAAIILAVWLGSRGPEPVAPSVEQIIAEALADVPKEDRFMVENMSMFQNYRDIVSYEEIRSVVDGKTLTALARLEAAGNL